MRSLVRCAVLMLVLSMPAQAQVFFRANLTGAQAVPSVTTNATGTFWGILDPASRLMYYQVTVARLQGFLSTGSIGVGAAGSAGVSLHSLVFFNNTAPGEWRGIPDSVMVAMLKGNAFVTIGTAAHAAGEIRGQLEMVNAIEFVFGLEGTQEVPPVVTPARGTGWLVLHSNGSAEYQFSVTALSGPATGAHFHAGAQGVAGPVVHPVAVSDSTLSGTWTNIPDSVIARMMRGEIYANVHTSSHPGGEIRGQLRRHYPATFRAYLRGAGVTPAVSGSGRGTGWIILGESGTGLEYRATYTGLTGPVTTNYLGIGAAGTAGTQVRATGFTGTTDDQAWNNFSDSVLVALVRGNLFLQLATSANPNGEIRGQFTLAEGMISSMVSLEARQEVPPVSSFANGTGVVMIDFSNGTVVHSERLAQLSGPITGSHFHRGELGVAGPVVLPITPVDTANEATITGVSDSVMLDMLRGRIYMNFHTAANAGGEARGQVLPRGFVTAVRQVSPLVPEQYHLSQNYPNPFNPTTQFEFEISSTDRVKLSIFNILGQEVAVLLDETRSPGTYQVTFDASSLPSGVYFYKMQAGNGFLASRKMVLIK